MHQSSIIYRTLIGIAIILVMVAAPSCDKDPVPNIVTMAQDSVAYNNTGQFLSISSASEWNIRVYSDSAADEKVDWFTVTPSSGTGDKHNVQLTYTQNDSENSRSVSIAVIFEKETVTLKFVQTGKSSGGGGGNPDKLRSDLVNKWMELPVVADTNSTVAYISHHFAYGTISVRNYSMLYDGTNKIALWVAYPLCGMYIGSESRSEAWGYDPKIPSSMQPTIFKAFGANGYQGYDRGHQIPSASRTVSYSANSQTFYFSNMTAQTSSFNQGIWGNLEGRVRGYAGTCDTLYVVTGPVLTTTANPGISYIKDNNGNDVALPKAYFKVLLKYNKTAETYSSIGFWFKNEPNSNKNATVSDAQTVKWIESQTGLTFFSNLPADKAASIKNEFNPSAWGL